MKKFLILFIFAVLFDGSAMAYDFSKVCSSGQTLYYNIISSTSVSVVSQNSSSPYYTTFPSGNLTIPSSVTYNGTTYSVTSIGESAFAGCNGLTSVTIGEAVTSIGDVAFWGCSGLTTVNFNATNCTTIGEQNIPYVWHGCTSLTTLNIGNNVTNIPDWAFYDCESLTSVTIPNSVTSIGSCAFIYCSGLTSVAIGNSVTSIGNDAFFRCSGLRSLTIGNSVNIIGVGAFYECSGLTGSLTIPNSVTSIGNDAFYNCSGLASVTIGNSVTSIGTSAFSGCSGLTGELTIPNSVTSIGNDAFSGCSGLTSVTIGEAVTSIGDFAFGGCSGLTSLNYNATNCTTMGSYGTYVFHNCSSLATLTIGENVTNIPIFAFYGCSELTAVNFNATNCTTMGGYFDGRYWSVFSFYTETLNIGENVTNIPEYAFIDLGARKVNYTGDVAGWCRIEFGDYSANPVFRAHNLYINNELVTDLTIPETISEIKAYAFYGDTCLTSLTIPNSVESIGSNAFYGCSGLTGELTIPNSVTSIDNGAFYECSGLTSITIGNGVTSIGYSAFAYCSNLITINYNAMNCTFMGNSSDHVFYNCTSLLTLNIGENVTNIPDFAFYDCRGLTTLTYNAANCTFGSNNGITGNRNISTLTIGESVTNFPGSAFWGLSGLTAVYYNRSIADWCGITFGGRDYSPVYYAHNLYINGELLTNLVIPESVTEIKPYSFCGASCITSLTISNSVTSIGEEAFYCSGLTRVDYTGDGAGWCRIEFGGYDANPVYSAHNLYINGELLTNLVIPESVAEIKPYSFCGAWCITLLTISNYVTSIGDGAFYRCNGLEKIYSNAETPATIGTNTFSSTVPIFVPCGAENNYLADEQWGSLNINSELPHSVTLNSNDEAMGTAVLLHQYCGSSTAVVEARPRYGYHFVHWNDGNTDNPRTITVTEDVIYTATFEVGDGIEENNMESKISLFPNPATDILNITSSETISEIEIVNTLGQVVKRIEVNADNAICNVNNLPNGIYVVRIRTLRHAQGAEIQRKFIKE